MKDIQQSARDKLVLNGRFCISEPGRRRKTVGQFRRFMIKNAEVFRKYFGTDLFPGSLNIHVRHPPNLQSELDAGRPRPSFCIPRGELRCMALGLGNGQAWRCVLECRKIRKPIKCWVFRRIGSGVDLGVIEVLAENRLVKCYDLRDGDAVTLAIFEGPNKA